MSGQSESIFLYLGELRIHIQIAPRTKEKPIPVLGLVDQKSYAIGSNDSALTLLAQSEPVHTFTAGTAVADCESIKKRHYFINSK